MIGTLKRALWRVKRRNVNHRHDVVIVLVAVGIVVILTATVTIVHEGSGEAKDNDHSQQHKETILSSLGLFILFGELSSSDKMFKTALCLFKSIDCKP